MHVILTLNETIRSTCRISNVLIILIVLTSINEPFALYRACATPKGRQMKRGPRPIHQPSPASHLTRLVLANTA